MNLAANKERAALFSFPGCRIAAEILRDVTAVLQAQTASRNPQDLLSLALALAVAYGSRSFPSPLVDCSSNPPSVCVRSAIGGGGHGATTSFRYLSHEFILIDAPNVDGSKTRFVVDPHFREQFEVSQPTPAYLELLSIVPEVFVGPISRLIEVVKAVCLQMAESFFDQGLTVPPWRKCSSIMSKWLPERFEHFEVSPPPHSLLPAWDEGSFLLDPPPQLCSFTAAFKAAVDVPRRIQGRVDSAGSDDSQLQQTQQRQRSNRALDAPSSRALAAALSEDGRNGSSLKKGPALPAIVVQGFSA